MSEDLGDKSDPAVFQWTGPDGARLTPCAFLNIDPARLTDEMLDRAESERGWDPRVRAAVEELRDPVRRRLYALLGRIAPDVRIPELIEITDAVAALHGRIRDELKDPRIWQDLASARGGGPAQRPLPDDLRAAACLDTALKMTVSS